MSFADALLMSMIMGAQSTPSSPPPTVSTTGELLQLCTTPLRQDFTSIQSDEKLIFALQTIASSSLANESQKSFASSALTPWGYYGLNGGSNASSRQSFYNTSDEKLQYESAVSIVSSRLNPSGVDAFNKCAS